MTSLTTLEAERALVGATLSGYPDPAELVDAVEAADFEDVHLEAIWRAVTSLTVEGHQPEPMRVRDRMGKAANSLPSGAAFLIDLMGEAHTVASAPYYARAVYDAARRRRVRTAAIRVQQMTTDPGYAEDTDTLVEAARAAIEDATATRTNSELRLFGDYLPEVYDVAENGRADGLSTPWPALDNLIRGLDPGRLIIVGARPGVGKSIMGVELARWVAHVHRRSVLFASLEMPGLEVSQRLVANHAEVSISGLMKGKGAMSEAGWEKARDGWAAMTEMPLFIEEGANQTLASIRSKAAEIRRKSEHPLGLIVVDYLQIMGVRDQNRNRAEAVGELSRGLKVLARDTGTAVVAMAQINRGPTQRQGGRPAMSDLRESGSIEADADIVVLLHRELFDDDTFGIKTDVIVAKNRSGPVSGFSLDAQGHYSRFVEPGQITRLPRHPQHHPTEGATHA